MVNKPSLHRTEILKLLQGAEEFSSGEELGRLVGISRVAVWKHIRQLREEGYRIEAEKQGYRLYREPGTLSPSDPNIDHERVHILDRVESTMQAPGKRTPPEGEVEFWVAREQSAGRGRGNKSWSSPAGGLYCTALFRPATPAAYAYLYLIRAGMSLAEHLGRNYDLDIRFVWPNDLYLGMRKLGGLLLEINGESESPGRGSLGVGINAEGTLNQEWNGISLREALQERASNADCTPRALFRLIEHPLRSALGALDPEAVRREWETRWLDRNREDIRGKELPGEPVGMSLSGGLILRKANSPAESLIEVSPGGRIIGRYQTYR